MSVCPACKGNSHLSGKPKHCPGGTWCDCQHRPVIMIPPLDQDVLLIQQGFVVVDEGGLIETVSDNVKVDS